MAVVCPAILARDAHEYQTQINRVTSFAQRVQIDLTDGKFAKAPTVTLEQVWWPESLKPDIHLMYQNPEAVLDDCIRLKPQMVIVHAEADGVFHKIKARLSKQNIKIGVALLGKTSTHVIKPSLKYIDHVMIFSGDLGKFGGVADLSLLTKVRQLKEWKPELEIGWDGGVNDTNAAKLVSGGVNVLNVGGYIQTAVDPRENFLQLQNIIS